MRTLLAAVVAAGMLLMADPARACSCTVRSPSAYLADASAAFRGEVVAVTGGGAGAVTALFAVDVVYKGTVPRSVPVRTGGNGDTCAIPLTEGGVYVVFASGDAGALSASLCGGTTEDRGYLDREGIAPASAAPSAPPGPAAAPVSERVASIPSRGGPITAAWLIALGVTALLGRARSMERSGRS